MARQHALGFGFIKEETQHHFLIRIPRSKKQKVVVYERFVWDESETQSTEISELNIKVMINYEKWIEVKSIVEKEFNRRLQSNNTIIGKFKIGDVPVERLFGKELVLLLWAIEDSDPNLIKVAIKNWLGLAPSERWWLFTMTNASTGHYANKRGWRIAIRYALTENPVDEKVVQGDIMELLYKQM